MQFNDEYDAGVNGAGHRLRINVQPVIPISISADWNLVSRTIVPIVRQEDMFADASPYLSDEDRYLRATSTLPIAAGVTYHSIMGSNDDVVSYASAHLDGAASEQIVTSGHSVQQTAAAILAIRTILLSPQ